VLVGKYAHLAETDSRTCAHPSPRKVHHLELVRSQENMCLCMCDRYHVFTMALQIIALHIFSRSLIEVVPKIHELLRYRCSKCPHGISQCNWWTLIRRTGHQFSQFPHQIGLETLQSLREKVIIEIPIPTLRKCD
jgi:hypothetical protein